MLYRFVDGAVVRAAAYQPGAEIPPWPDLIGDTDEHVVGWSRWLRQVWASDGFAASVEVASPALARRVRDVCEGRRVRVREVRRAVLSVMRYLLRARSRATPFGLFAGVAPARFGPELQLRDGEEHLAVAQLDSEWLVGVITRLERSSELRRRLPVVLNNLAFVRDGRLVVGCQQQPAGSGRAEPAEVSARRIKAVETVMQAARSPIRVGELADKLTAEYPGRPESVIEGMLAELVARRFLITSLRPPMTATDPLGHLVAELTALGAETIPQVAELFHDLRGIHLDVSRHNHASSPTEKRERRDSVSRRMTAIITTERPVTVDLRVDCALVLPHAVAREAEAAASALARLTPYPFGFPAWQDYHARFRARYGTSALVPVLELVADSGLGLPADYLGSARGRTAHNVTERDEKLLTLIQRATLDGSGEIVLTDQMIEDLAASDPADVHLPARAEVAVEIRSESLEALTRGRFALTVTGTPRPGSSMAGRHAHLLPDEGRDLFAETYTATEPDAVAAQLSFAPRRRRNENVARTEQLLPHVIPIAEHREPNEHLIPLADLAVTVDDRRFYLIRMSTGQRVDPRVAHALEAGIQTPPLARFLAEITIVRSAVYKAFHFGTAAKLPYLPRVRYRRTILSPARWLLTAQELPGRSASTAEWEARLESWRIRWRVPERVAMVDHDRRQPVDLGHRLHRVLLRTRLERAGRLELRETSAPEDLAWLGRAHEVLIPLVLDAPAAAPVSIISPPRFVARDAGHLPGNSMILCAQIHGHPGRFDEILTERLPGLIDAFGDDALCWWFRRHREMRRPEVDQYLAVYLRLSEPSLYGSAAEWVAVWSDRLRRDRLLSQLTFATHEPQSGRYGHGPAMDRAYDVFAADSAAALAQITMTIRAGAHPQALAAASLVDLAACFAGSAQAGLGWLVRELPQEHGRLEPGLRAQALELADPHGTGTTLRSLPGGEDVVAAWRTRAIALATYGEHLAGQRARLRVLRSLLHLHHIRAVGVDPDVERVTGRLARVCALRHTADREER